MSVDDTVENFRLFLEASWVRIAVLIEGNAKSESWLDDWLQANWEILVESQLCSTPEEFLEVYGEGADCNGPSGRVWMPDAIATHRVCCVPRFGSVAVEKMSEKPISTEGLTVGGFVNWDGKQYSSVPPFNCILLEGDNEIFIFDLEVVSFDLRTV